MARRVREIVIVSHYFPPHIGGIEIVAQAEAEGLAVAGYGVSVVTSKVHASEHSGQIHGVEVSRIPALNMFEKYGIPFPIFSPLLVVTLFRKAKQADVIHIHDTFYLSSLVGGLAAWYHKKPLVLTQHVDLVRHPNRFVGLIERLVYAVNGLVIFHSSQRVLVINDRTERFLVNRGVERRKLVRHLNGVDSRQFRPAQKRERIALRKKLGLDENEFTVLFVGRFAPKKGFGTLLAARDASYQLVFVGGDTPAQSYEHVKFCGRIRHEELADYYRAADAFVLPSQDEGFPLTVQEAMSCGLPVITSDDPGYTMYMLDPARIWLIRQPTTKKLKTAIESLVADPNQQKRMARYSRHYALSHFSWQQHVADLEKIYEESIVGQGFG